MSRTSDSLSIPTTIDDGWIVRADNLELMRGLPDGMCQLIYADPPFFSGKHHRQTKTPHAVRDTWPGGVESYLDFLRPRLCEMRRLLTPSGTLYVHVDWHAVHHVRILLDEIFGADHFANEVIWSYRTGGRSQRWFARKHDNLLVYVRTPGQQKFNVIRDGQFRTDGLNRDEEGRPYKQTRAGRLYFHMDGPAVTDVWEIPFLSTVSLERTGYPTQKPEALLERIVRAATDEGDLVADFFCGSGTAPAVARRLGRRWIGCDAAAEAVEIAEGRLKARAGRVESAAGEA